MYGELKAPEERQNPAGELMTFDQAEFLEMGYILATAGLSKTGREGKGGTANQAVQERGMHQK